MRMIDQPSGAHSSYSEERSWREWCLPVPSLEMTHLYLHSWKSVQLVIWPCSTTMWRGKYWETSPTFYGRSCEGTGQGKDTGGIKIGNNSSSIIITDFNFPSTILCFPLICHENVLLLWWKKSKIYNYFHVLGYVWICFFVVWCLLKIENGMEMNKCIIISNEACTVNLSSLEQNRKGR